MFQIHNEEIFKIIEEKLSKINVEIITLPYDSIHPKVHNIVVERFKKIVKMGANIFQLAWNVGDPERTSTATNVWYCYHGKFIVTDKVAIALSANLTDNPEIDAMLLMNEDEKIKDFVNKFEILKKRFIIPHGEYQGTIRKEIEKYQYERIQNGEIFKLPGVITNNKIASTWIRDYPPELCQEDMKIEEKLMIIPFDCRGRNVYIKIINEAQEYLYVSTETFTDVEINRELIKAKLRGVDIKILTGYYSMDFPDRVQKNFLTLLGFNIEIRTPKEELHAKLMITEKILIISSMNLNKIGLGFKINKNFWRENTETIFPCFNSQLIEDAKQQFLSVFYDSNNIIDRIALKGVNNIGSLISKVHDFKSSKGSKEILSKINEKLKIQANKKFHQILQDAIEIAKKRKSRILTEDDVRAVIKKSKD